MYTDYFGLDELPFSITPDTGFFYPGDQHQQALNTLLVAVGSGEGFLKITGEVGTGKTLLCRKFLGCLEASGAVTAYIPNPYVGPMTLLLGVADELAIEYPQRLNQHQLLKLLTRFLMQAAGEGRRVVLCLDEAQALPVETMEALRLLSNLETERRKLLQVVLFGQPELDRKLNKPAIRQLRQRITFSHRLRPLSRDDVEDYLAHRLRIAGWRGARLFSRAATGVLHRASGGVPRLVNILAHKSLMLAFGQGCSLVEAVHVHSAVRDTESVARPRRLHWLLASVAAALLSCSAMVWSAWL